jgi:uncharacterized membrane protein YphA (DoxX/SURF4 family)
MGSSDSTAHIARDVAQRRVALLLLPLRLWVGIGWLRAGLEKVVQPDWFDGTALTQFVQQQADAGTAPWLIYIDLLARLVERAATPLGLAVVCAQIAIGLCLLTGTLTNLALLTAIAINVNLILAGIAAPNHFYIVIQVVLLAGGAGAAYGLDRWLSQVLRTSLLTGHRGLVDGVELSRGALVLLAVSACGLGAAAVPRIGSVLSEGGMNDPGFTLVALGLVVALLVMALTRPVHRSDEESGVDDFLGIGFPPGGLGPSDTAMPGASRPGAPVPGASMPGAPVPGSSMPGAPVPAAPVPRAPAPSSLATRPPFDDRNGVPVPPRGPAPDTRVPMAAPPRARPGAPARRPPAQPRSPSDPWQSPGPLGDPPMQRSAPQDQPTTAMQPQTPQPRPAPRDQPTTQFVRQRRSRRPQGSQAPPPANDPYAELRELPP